MHESFIFSYAGSDINLDHFTPTCKHSNSNDTKFECLDVPKKVLLSQKQKIYADTIKLQQDNRVSQLMQVRHPKRHRERENVKSHKPHTMQINYTVRIIRYVVGSFCLIHTYFY